MLSDEERKVVENLKTEYEKLIKEDNILFPLYKNDAKRLLNLIEKQSKEIEELKEMKKELTERVLRLESDKFWDNVVSKDKIKAKIEEYKEKCKNCNFRGKICDEFTKNYECIIGVCLKEFYSLLEKE